MKLFLFFCLPKIAGTLITTRHILTAAHCLDKSFLQIFRLGEHNISTNQDGQHFDFTIGRFLVHENFNQTTEINDIAMVYLPRNVEFTGELKFDLFASTLKRNSSFSTLSLSLISITDRIRPICLPMSKDMRSRSFVGTLPFVGNYNLSFDLFV